jgi:hypothetical protein
MILLILCPQCFFSLHISHQNITSKLLVQVCQRVGLLEKSGANGLPARLQLGARDRARAVDVDGLDQRAGQRLDRVRLVLVPAGQQERLLCGSNWRRGSLDVSEEGNNAMLEVKQNLNNASDSHATSTRILEYTPTLLKRRRNRLVFFLRIPRAHLVGKQQLHARIHVRGEELHAVPVDCVG